MRFMNELNLVTISSSLPSKRTGPEKMKLYWTHLLTQYVGPVDDVEEHEYSRYCQLRQQNNTFVHTVVAVLFMEVVCAMTALPPDLLFGVCLGHPDLRCNPEDPRQDSVGVGTLAATDHHVDDHVEDDCEEGDTDAEYEPYVHHLEVGGLWQGGGDLLGGKWDNCLE